MLPDYSVRSNAFNLGLMAFSSISWLSALFTNYIYYPLELDFLKWLLILVRVRDSALLLLIVSLSSDFLSLPMPVKVATDT